MCRVSQPACPGTQAGAQEQPRTLDPDLQGGRVLRLWTGGLPLSLCAGHEMAFPALASGGSAPSIESPEGVAVPTHQWQAPLLLKKSWEKALVNGMLATW